MSGVDDSRPILVDLDGSLLRTDSLHELCFLAIKKNILTIFLMPFWIIRGKVFLKKYLYENTSIDISSLPYNQKVIAYLQKQHDNGRSIILCTGAWYQLAERIAVHFDWIDYCKASDEMVNFTGKNKAKWAVDRYGIKGFDYLGNSTIDLEVWKHSHSAIVVGGQRLVNKCKKLNIHILERISDDDSLLYLWLKAIRVHQWSKNTLLFIPIFTAHKFEQYDLVLDTMIAFFAFNLCASGTYIINDLLDLRADRAHDSKKYRPFASGKLQLNDGLIISFFLLFSSLAISAYIGEAFLVSVIVYIVVTLLYSFYLKTLQTIDVIILAGLFTLRVIAGAAAINIVPSFWLLSFSMFMFLSLALVKRVTELIKKQNMSSNTPIIGRGYFTADIMILQSLGSCSGFLAVLVFSLYINSEEVTQQYAYPRVLWLMCPILGYWIMRVWMLVVRNQINQDPIVFAISDKNSWLAALLACLVFIIAS